MEYMSCPEAAEKWGISERRVQILCKENRIPGVMLSRLVDTFFSRTSWTMLLYAENHSISVA